MMFQFAYPLAAACSPPPCGEGSGVGVAAVVTGGPPPRLASLADPPRKGEGKGERAMFNFAAAVPLAAACSPPPCGEGLGVGAAVVIKRGAPPRTPSAGAP